MLISSEANPACWKLVKFQPWIQRQCRGKLAVCDQLKFNLWRVFNTISSWAYCRPQGHVKMSWSCHHTSGSLQVALYSQGYEGEPRVKMTTCWWLPIHHYPTNTCVSGGGKPEIFLYSLLLFPICHCSFIGNYHLSSNIYPHWLFSIEDLAILIVYQHCPGINIPLYKEVTW